jgi:hypothetical protein
MGAADRIVRADVDAQRHVHARGIAIVGQLADLDDIAFDHLACGSAW